MFGFAWLIAWPYVLPWYDGLAWALLALLPWTSLPWAALDWLVLARTAALAFGYLPARGIALPSGLGWLQSVVRTAVTQPMAQVFEDHWIKACMIVLDDAGNATHNAVAFHSVLYTPGLS